MTESSTEQPTTPDGAQDGGAMLLSFPKGQKPEVNEDDYPDIEEQTELVEDTLTKDEEDMISGEGN